MLAFGVLAFFLNFIPNVRHRSSPPPTRGGLRGRPARPTLLGCLREAPRHRVGLPVIARGGATLQTAGHGAGGAGRDGDLRDNHIASLEGLEGVTSVGKSNDGRSLVIQDNSALTSIAMFLPMSSRSFSNSTSNFFFPSSSPGNAAARAASARSDRAMPEGGCHIAREPTEALGL